MLLTKETELNKSVLSIRTFIKCHYDALTIVLNARFFDLRIVPYDHRRTNWLTKKNQFTKGLRSRILRKIPQVYGKEKDVFQ